MVVGALAAGLVLAAASCSSDDAKNAENEVRKTVTSALNKAESATRLTANLTGTAEVPGPGAPDGTGKAMLNVDVTKTQVCYDVSVQKLDHPTAMHIHEGGTGKAGGIVVTLNPPASGDSTSSGCADASVEILGRLVADPGSFYVNVHTDTYPQGAIRGQLSQ
jgi:hypothetical protein